MTVQGVAREPAAPTGLSRTSFLLWFGIWLAFLAQPAFDLLGRHYSPARTVVGWVALAAFAALYLRNAWVGFRDDLYGEAPYDLRAYVALLILGLALILYFSSSWAGLIIYLGVATGSRLELRPAAVALGLLGLFEVVHGTLVGHSPADLGFLAFMTIMLGVSMLFIRRNMKLLVEVRAARDEVARLAVADERLRFSRDLHDVLGHSLSVIALQSQVARRLMVLDPGAAEGALRELEKVAQDSLGSVREIATEYRGRSLNDELRGAEEVLGAAGIRVEVDSAARGLSEVCDGLLAWAVREGVTNVLRHSRARSCTIDIQQDDKAVRMRMADDGLGGEVIGEGSGLRGLRQRLAPTGGTLEAGPGPGGGFSLKVRLPLRA